LLEVLYGRETWSLALREESKLSISENRMLRRIFGPKRDEKTGEWKKLHNDELVLITHYGSSGPIEKNEMVGARSTYGEKKMCIRGFGGETLKKETTWKTQLYMRG
jgi:hypothetical protein